MRRTPAPPSTPLVAAITWSGTGEVNTSPAQAASSIPGPTKPACIGSRPGPPPGTMAPLPGAGDDADLAVHRSVPPEHHPVLVLDAQLGVGCGQAPERVGDDVRGVVDELLHLRLLASGCPVTRVARWRLGGRAGAHK